MHLFFNKGRRVVDSNSNKNSFKAINGVCKDVDECLSESICQQNSACKNTGGSYFCLCTSGFSLKER